MYLYYKNSFNQSGSGALVTSRDVRRQFSLREFEARSGQMDSTDINLDQQSRERLVDIGVTSPLSHPHSHFNSTFCTQPTTKEFTKRARN